jgi:hypothetical protein
MILAGKSPHGEANGGRRTALDAENAEPAEDGNGAHRGNGKSRSSVVTGLLGVLGVGCGCR